MNLDSREWVGRGLQFRVVAAVLVLLLVGCVVFGLASRSLSPTATASQISSPAPAGASPMPLSVADAKARARSLFAGLPLMFEPNRGQANLDPANPRSQFVARGSGYSLLLGSEGAILELYSRVPPNENASKPSTSGPNRVTSLQMKFAGANPKPALTGANLLPGKSNYLLGNDPAKWRKGIPQFARVRYEEIYPGINLVFYGNQGHLEYDFQVAPGADPSRAELEFDGAKRLELKDGALVIHCEDGGSQGPSILLETPRVYQQIAGREQPVEGRFELRAANRAGFAVSNYDRSRELVIDPKLSFSTYFGGPDDERNTSVAVDTAGNIYLAGSTDSPGLATAGTFQQKLNTTVPGDTNVYIAQITPPQGTSAATLNYVTYLGGTGNDSPVGVGVDAAQSVYVAGTTTSTNFPVSQTAYQQQPEDSGNGNQHVFVSKLNGPTGGIAPASSLLYSSYLSGNGIDIATGMTIDAQQNLYVTGTTTSVEALLTSQDQFPATQTPEPLPYQSSPRGVPQFFVTKVYTASLGIGSIAYSTYFGGGEFKLPPVGQGPQTPAIGGGIAVDTNGNIYFSGTTDFVNTGASPLTDFPILNAYQPCLDESPATVVVGNPPCQNTSFQNHDAFAAKLNPNVPQGEQLQWSTYLGGGQLDFGNGIAVDAGANNVFVVGTTNSPDFVAAGTLTTFAAYQKCLNNLFTGTGTAITCNGPTSPPIPNDAFVARLTNPTSSSTTPTNVSLTYFSYLGGQNDEEGLAITVNSADSAFITGWTQSPTAQTAAAPTPPSGSFPVFPFPSSIQSQLNGFQDAFIASLNTQASSTGQNTTASWATYYGGSTPGAGTGSQALGEGTSIVLDSSQNIYVAGDTNASDLQLVEQLGPTSGGNSGNYNGGEDAFVALVGTAAQLSLSGALTRGTNQTYISAGNQATFTYTLINNGPDPANRITITDDLSRAGIPLTLVSASAPPGAGACSGGSTSTTVICNIQSLQAGSTVTITIVVTPTATSSGAQEQFNGGFVEASAANGINTPFVSVPAQMSDFTISAGPSNISIAAGDTATYQVQLVPHPVYGNGISLLVSGLPSTGPTTATFTSPTVTLEGSSGATSTLIISTTARPVTTPTASLWTRRFYAIFLVVPGLTLLTMRGSRRRKRIAGFMLLGLVLAVSVLQPACSHTSTPAPLPGTPAGQYTLTITGESGSDVKSAVVVLNVS